MSWPAANGTQRSRSRRLPRGSLLFCVWLAVLTACAALPPEPERRPTAEPALSGKVSLDGNGVPGAEVLLYDPLFYLPPVQPAVAQTLSGADGEFRLEVPTGTYLVLARRGDHVAFFGRNPVRHGGPTEGVHLPLVPAHPITRTPVNAADEGLHGRVLHKGQPVTDARVFVYLDPARGFRGPGFVVSEPTTADGRFQVTLAPGTYFVVARYRPQGWRTGGLEPGDQLGMLSELPLVLHQGEQADVVIETVEVPSREQMARFHGRKSVLTGRVVDSNGSPLAGFRAALYDNPQMLDQPRTVSEPTGPDGEFTLETDLSGTVYLGARELLGGPPALDERVGFYRSPNGAGLTLSSEEQRQGLTIVVQGR